MLLKPIIIEVFKLHDHDYLYITLLFPVIAFNEITLDQYANKESNNVLELNTGIQYTYKEYYWNFVLALLGFGVIITREYE